MAQPDTITYGNWFERKGAGLFGLTTAGTLGGMVGLLVIVLTITLSQNIGIVVIQILAFLVLEVFFGIKFDGKTLARHRGERRDAKQRARRGESDYVTGVLATLEGEAGGHPLPGILANTEILHGVDGYGTPFDVIHYQHRGLFAVVLRGFPDGTGTNDQDFIDHTVAYYGAWLASLSEDPGLVGATVTIDSAPSTGVALREAVRLARNVATAPKLATHVTDELADRLRNNSHEAAAFITLVWRGSSMNDASTGTEDVLVEIAKRLPAHRGALAAGGAGDPEMMLEADLVEVARTAYEPATAEAFDVLRERGEAVELGWKDAGPSFGSESRGVFRHDGGASFTVEQRVPPRGIVRSRHLQRLVSPHEAFLRKRVTVFYQPTDIGRGQMIAERTVKAEDFNASQQKGRRTATTGRRRAQAEKLDEEIAAGATLVPFALMATATFTDTPDAERRAKNTLTTLMTDSRMKVRGTPGLQAAAFHLTLPFGLIPWEHTGNPLWK